MTCAVPWHAAAHELPSQHNGQLNVISLLQARDRNRNMRPSEALIGRRERVRYVWLSLIEDPGPLRPPPTSVAESIGRFAVALITSLIRAFRTHWLLGVVILLIGLAALVLVPTSL